MNRRLPIAITLGLLLVLLGLFAQAIWGVEFVKKRRELDLEEWLGAIGVTFAGALDAGSLGLLAATYESAPSMALLSAGGVDIEPAWPDDLVLTPGEAAEASYILRQMLLELREAHDLQSATLLSEGGYTLAASNNEVPPGQFWALYEIDRAEIRAAGREGKPIPKPLYQVGDELQKRVYTALPATDAATVAEIPGFEVDSPVDIDAPRVFLRLEASADYLAEIARVRHISNLVATIGGVIVLVVAVVFYLLLRRLQLSTERLAREDRFRSLGKLAAGLAHEMRNPLGIMRFSVDELEWAGDAAATGSGAAKDDLKRLAGDMRGEIDRVNRLISDMLSFSQESELNAKGACDLWPTLTSCGKWLEKSAPQSWELELPQMSIESPDDAWTNARVAIDGDALRQITLNLLRNSAEALEGQSDPPPSVRLAVVLDGKSCRIIVADNGPGIPRKVARRIFEPFFSAKKEGTGLGLALSRRLAESVGGTLQFEPVSPRGSKFRLTIPLVD